MYLLHLSLLITSVRYTFPIASMYVYHLYLFMNNDQEGFFHERFQKISFFEPTETVDENLVPWIAIKSYVCYHFWMSYLKG